LAGLDPVEGKLVNCNPPSDEITNLKSTCGHRNSGACEPACVAIKRNSVASVQSAALEGTMLRIVSPMRTALPSSIKRITVTLLKSRRPNRQWLPSLIKGPRVSAIRQRSEA
jgi:hypothetical protein